MLKLKQIKGDLKAKGWSYRAAAKRIGKSAVWISQVLNGHNTSKPVLDALQALPAIKPARKTRQ